MFVAYAFTGCHLLQSSCHLKISSGLFLHCGEEHMRAVCLWSIFQKSLLCILFCCTWLFEDGLNKTNKQRMVWSILFKTIWDEDDTKWPFWSTKGIFHRAFIESDLGPSKHALHLCPTWASTVRTGNKVLGAASLLWASEAKVAVSIGDDRAVRRFLGCQRDKKEMAD